MAEDSQTPARYKPSNLLGPLGMQQNLTKFFAQSDVVHDLWEPPSIRKQTTNLWKVYSMSLPIQPRLDFKGL